MNRKKTVAAILTALIALTAVFIFSGSEKPQKQEFSDYSSPLNFQGEMNGVKLSESGLMLDTRTVLKEEDLFPSHSLAGASEEKIYYTANGSFKIRTEQETRSLDLETPYGAVTGDFSRPGYNMIYGNNNGEAYIRNLDTGEETLLFKGIVEILKADRNGDGRPESAEIRLRNGSQFYFKPITREPERNDWDGDGYSEKIYSKNSDVYMYDRKHGQEKISNGSQVAFQNEDILVQDLGHVKKLNFEQKYLKEGNYISRALEFKNYTEIHSITFNAEIPGETSVEAETMTPSSNSTFHLRDGKTVQNLNVRTDSFKVKLTLEGTPDKTPEILGYSLTKNVYQPEQ